MKNLRKLIVFISFIAFSGGSWSFSNFPLSGNLPDVIHVRTNCFLGDPQLEVTNCADNMDEALDWAWGTRNPTAASPLRIDIGPGRFPIVRQFTCTLDEPVPVQDRGHTSFRGSGRANTSLTIGSARNFGAIDIHGCIDLTFQDLTIDAVTPNGQRRFGIIWREGGSSIWQNVEVISGGYGWYDTRFDFSGNACGSGSPGRHEWHSSRIRNIATFFTFNIAYYSGCGDSWIYGTELLAENTSGSPAEHLGIKVAKPTGSVHLYGSDVRVIAKPGATPATVQAGLSSSGGGLIHHHGGEIVVRHEEPGNDQTVVGIAANGTGSRVHVLETSFGILPAGNGTAIRAIAVNGGSAESAFQWVSGPNAPTPGDTTRTKHVQSIDGQDTFIETDCPINAGCQSAGSFPHQMIYTSACIGTGADKGPWFDTVTNTCRGEP